MADQGKQLEEPRKFDQNQYDRLLECAASNDMSEWNKWRELFYPSRQVDIELEEAEFGDRNSQKTSQKTVFDNANLDKAFLKKSVFWNVSLNKASFRNAELEEVGFTRVDLRNADFYGAKLKNSVFTETRLDGADLTFADLSGADFEYSSVDGATIIAECQYDDTTSFCGVNLESARIDPRLFESFKYIIRKKQWHDWYEEINTRNPFGALRVFLIKFFWWLSNYGSSTSKIFYGFTIIAGIFALIYYGFGIYDYFVNGILVEPGIIKGLFVQNGKPYYHPFLFFVHAIFQLR